ncbi:MAG: hypothetical protein Q9181_005490 [Wetmoreana brouardii]
MIDQGTCHTVIRAGINTCCCNRYDCQPWGDPCGGDLAYPLCSTDEILRPEFSGNAYFGDSRPVDQGAVCYAPGNCQVQKYEYKYVCCGCPYKYKTYDTADACDTGNMCVGCNNMPYEKLNGTFETGYQCIPVDKPCPGLSTMSDPKLKGAQVVVAPAFQRFVEGLIACANSQLGAKGGLNVQSTSRCGKSVGLTPAEVSGHQIGQAIDTNLYLNDSSPCDRDVCMRQGYCAYHPAALNCKNYPITQDKKKNEQVSNFLTCECYV